jgi:hypothetical protein
MSETPRLNEQLAAWIEARTKELQAKGEAYFVGTTDRDQVSPCEQEVFALSPGDMPRIAPVYDAFVAIADCETNEFSETDLCARAQRAFPWMERRQVAAHAFERFAALFGISNRLACSFVTKVGFFEIRQGVGCFEDEKAREVKDGSV